MLSSQNCRSCWFTFHSLCEICFSSLSCFSKSTLPVPILQTSLFGWWASKIPQFLAIPVYLMDLFLATGHPSQGFRSPLPGPPAEIPKYLLKSIAITVVFFVGKRPQLWSWEHGYPCSGWKPQSLWTAKVPQGWTTNYLSNNSPDLEVMMEWVTMDVLLPWQALPIRRACKQHCFTSSTSSFTPSCTFSDWNQEEYCTGCTCFAEKIWCFGNVLTTNGAINPHNRIRSFFWCIQYSTSAMLIAQNTFLLWYLFRPRIPICVRLVFLLFLWFMFGTGGSHSTKIAVIGFRFGDSQTLTHCSVWRSHKRTVPSSDPAAQFV